MSVYALDVMIVGAEHLPGLVVDPLSALVVSQDHLSLRER